VAESPNPPQSRQRYPPRGTGELGAISLAQHERPPDNAAILGDVGSLWILLTPPEPRVFIPLGRTGQCGLHESVYWECRWASWSKQDVSRCPVLAKRASAATQRLRGACKLPLREADKSPSFGTAVVHGAHGRPHLTNTDPLACLGRFGSRYLPSPSHLSLRLLFLLP
jgi:hypothetical protein